MRTLSYGHFGDQEVLRELAAIVACERGTTAAMLACLAEVDGRKLYRSAGYASTYDYCVRELRMSEAVAYKRIRVARKVGRYPNVLAALVDGRLNLSGVVLLAPRLTDENADELLGAAANQSNESIGLLLAQRFPRADLPTKVEAVGSAPSFADQLAVRLVGSPAEASAVVPAESPRPRVTPLAPQRYALQVTMPQTMHEKLREARELLGHQIPSGDIAQVLERALDVLLAKLRKQKYGATSRPQANRKPRSSNPRFIPAAARRAVWQRDGGRCTFVSESGHRCESKRNSSSITSSKSRAAESRLSITCGSCAASTISTRPSNPWELG